MKVLILGNGFDLASGLKTSYSDFFKARQNKIDAIRNVYDEIFTKLYPSSRVIKTEIHKKRLYELHLLIDGSKEKLKEEIVSTLDIFSCIVKEKISFESAFWYAYLMKKKNMINWCDVEKGIQDVFDSNLIEQITSSKEKVILRMESYDFNSNNLQDLDRYAENIFCDCDETEKNNIFLEMLLRNIDKENIYERLMNSLNEFEEEFRHYIESQFRRVTEKEKNMYQYFANYESLFSDERSRVAIINFNYTTIENVKFALIEKERVRYTFTENNVHGIYDKEIIFGIDSEDIKIKDNINEYKFTKTFRKINSSESIKSYPLFNERYGVEIIFFGHSLAQADYSYFQSIFDFYDIYNSSVKINFKYSLYKSEEKSFEDQKNEYTQNVVRLMEKYGQSFNNQIHGDNLLHKLLIENRIIIQNITGEIKAIL